MIDLYAPICRFVTIPLWARWEKSDYLRHYRTIRLFQYRSEAEIRRWQWERLRAKVIQAYADSPFYQELYETERFHPDQLRSWEDVGRIPILSKDVVKGNWRRMISRRVPEKELVYGKTSGSTGKPLEFVIDEPGAQVQRAFALLTQEWAGHRHGRRVFTLFGRSTAQPNSRLRHILRRTLLNRTTNLCTLELTDANMLAFYRALRRYRRPFIYGYAHALFLFATFIERQKLPPLQGGGVISGGMPLHPWQREKIREFLNCRVVNRYGCEELGTIACQCEEGGGLHVHAYSKYVEIIGRGGEPIPPGSTGYLVVTDFDNAAMPFIRYRIEDLGSAAGHTCSCGRGLPLIERLEGRESDFIRTPEGKLVSGISLTDNFGASIPGVFQLQLVQDRIDHITVRIVRDASFSPASLETIARLNREFFGPRMKYSCEYLPAIPVEPSGKSRFVISRISQEGA